jgi:hypothetical protein
MGSFSGGPRSACRRRTELFFRAPKTLPSRISRNSASRTLKGPEPRLTSAPTSYGFPSDGLVRACAALSARFEDFRQALERRDGAAYRTAVQDLLERLTVWSGALDRVVVPALERIPRRDLARELTVDLVQLRELARHIVKQIETGAPLSDLLGMVENFRGRLAAHARQMSEVYAPAAATALRDDDYAELVLARPPD